MSTIRIKRSAEPDKVPSFDQLELGELALNTYDGKLFFKREQEEGNFAIRELGARDATDNVFYVTTTGSDENDGKTIGDAFATIHHALSVIPEGSTLYVKAGQHTVKNPVKIPAFCAIVGDSLRTTFVQPEFEDQDMFWVNNGCFLKDMRFNNFIAPSAAVSFPPDGSAGSIMCSPYVQNCTAYTTTGTGMRVDGSVVTGLRSMVVDAYTQYNQGGIGVHHLNRGNTQLVSIFTISCDISILCETGGFCSLTNSNTSFGNYGLISDGYSEALFSASAGANVNRSSMIFNDLTNIPYIQNAAVFSDTEEVYTIKDATPIKVGQGVVTGPTFTTEDAELQEARTVVLAQKEAIQKATVDFVKETYQTDFDEAKCRRDTGEILDAIANDLALGSNYRSLTAGLAYTRANSTYLINNQKTQTADAIEYVKGRVASLVPTGLTTTSNGLFDIIIDLLNNQQASAYYISNNYLTTLNIPAAGNSSSNEQNAVARLENNRTFLQAEVIAYIADEVANATPGSIWEGFTYNSDKCSRDVGLIVDALQYDLMYSSNTASVEVAKAYYVGAASQVDGQEEQTVAAYNHLAAVASDIVEGTSVTPTTGNTETVDTSGSDATATEGTEIDTLIGITTTYIADGETLPTEVEPDVVALGVTSDELTAYNSIVAEKDNLVQDTIVFVEANYVLLEFNQAKCYRDTGLIIEAVIDDMVFGTNYKSVVAGRTYGSSTAALVISDQKEETLAALEYAKTEVLALLDPPSAASSDADRLAYERVDANFNLVLEIIENGFADYDSSGLIEFPAPTGVFPEITRAQTNIQLNKDYLIAEGIAYINQNYPLLGYNREICERDVGLVIDAISYDMMFGSNFRSITAGRSYLRGALQGVATDRPLFTTTSGVTGTLITSDPTTTTLNVGSNSTTVTTGETTSYGGYGGTVTVEQTEVIGDTVVPPEQKAATVSAFLHLKDLMKAIVSETVAIERIEDNMNLIVDIIQDGISRVPSDYDLPTPTSGTGNASDTTIANVISNIDNNRDFITAEVKQYIENEFPQVSETYDDDGKCSRDIGYILDAVVYDLTYGGNLETLIAGRSYFSDVVAAADGDVDQLGSQFVDVDIASVTLGNPITISTEEEHGLRDAFTVTLFDLNGPIRLNAQTFFVKVVDETTFQLYTDEALTQSVDGANYQEYINRGYVRVNRAEVIATVESYRFLRDLVRQIGANTDVTELQTAVDQVLGSGVATYSASAATRAGSLVEDIITIIENDSSEPQEEEPVLTWVDGYDANIAYPVGFSNQGLYTDHLILQGEKGDLQKDVTFFIESNFAYDQATCERDLGYIIDAVVYDTLYKGNSQSFAAAKQYYNSRGQIVIPDLQRRATGDALDLLEDRIGDVLRSNRVVPTQNQNDPNFVAQDTSTTATTITEILRIQKLFEVLSSVVRRNYFINDFIDNIDPDFENQSAAGNEIREKILAERQNLTIKTIKFIDTTFREFRFDEEVCARDVGLILDAVSMDVALGTNYNSIIAGLSYQRGSASIAKVKAEQFPQTLAAIKYLKDEVLEISGLSDLGKARATAAFDELIDIFENGATSTRQAANALNFVMPVGVAQNTQDAHTLLQGNRTFIQEEIIAWIDDQFTNFTYDEDKCLRDTQLLLDAVNLDTVLNTNYNTITAGLAYQRANASEVLTGQKIQTVAAIAHLKEKVDELTKLSTQGRARMTRLIDVVLDILDGAFTYDSTYDSTDDAGVVENIELNNPANATQDQTDAKDQLRINKEFIATDVVQYINNNYPNLDYVESKCKRDVEFIIDAINFDVLYGGNSATVQAAKSYFVGTIDQLAEGQADATIDGYVHLKDLIAKIVVCDEVTPTPGHNLVQKIESDPGSAAEVTRYQALIDIIIEVIKVGNITGLPVQEYPVITWADANLQRDFVEIAQETAKNTFTPYGAAYNPVTGIMTLEIGPHPYEYGDKIRLKEESLAFTCGSDGNLNVLRHPRTKEAAYNTDLTVENVTQTTITVNVGTSPETSAHTFVSASEGAVTSAVAKTGLADTVVAYVNDEFVNFTYDIDKCARDVGIITVGTAFDVAMGTNYNSVTSGLAYQRANANKVQNYAQKDITIAAYQQLKKLMFALSDVNGNQTATGPFYVFGTDNITPMGNGEGYYYPLYTDQAAAELADDGSNATLGAGAHIHVFTEYPGVTFYMPNKFMNHAIAEKPTGFPSYEVIKRVDDAIDEIIDIFSNGPSAADTVVYPNPTDATAAVISAKDLIQANKDAIVTDTIAFIEANSNLVGTYDQDKCRRDSRLILDAVALDMVLGTNYNSVYAGISYQRGSNSELLNSNQKGATLNAIRYLKARVLELSDVKFKVSDGTANTDAVNRLTANFDEVLDIIENGSVSAEVPGDSASVADAINFDVDGDGNIGPASYPGTTAYAGRVIANSIAAANRLINNKDFLVAEVKAFIGTNDPSLDYDETRCERDVKYILDGITFDVLYGGNLGTRLNAQAYFEGTTIDQLPADQRTITADAYAHLTNKAKEVLVNPSVSPTITGTTPNTLTADLSGADATAVESNLIDGLLQEIEDAVRTGTLDTLSVEVLPSVGFADSDLINARVQVRNDEHRILDSTINYINTQLSYNQVSCERDLRFILDALSYDVLYGGNSATNIAADAYFVGTTSQLGTNSVETTATIDAYNNLKTLIANILSGEAGATEQTRIDGYIDTIVTVITDGNTDSLPSTPTYPSYTWADAEYVAAGDAIFAEATSFGTSINAFLLENFPERTYDRTRCKRDVGFIVDALSYDVLYGGNSAIREVARSYFSFAINQLGSDEKETRATLEAYKRLQDVVSDVVLGNTVVTSTKNTESQDTGDSSGAVATTIEASRLSTLLAIVIATIDEQGTNNLPDQELPAIDWAATALQNDFDSILANKENAKAEVLQFIEDRYTTFKYDQFKCSRDIGLILNAVLEDTIMNSNYQSLLAGSSYYRASASVVFEEQLPETIRAIEFLRDEVKKVLTDPFFTATVAPGTFDTPAKRAITPVEAIQNAKTTTKVYGDTAEYARLLARFEDVLRTMANGLVTTVTFSTPVTLSKNEIVRQAGTKAFGRVKDNVTDATTVELIEVSGTFNTADSNTVVASATGELSAVITGAALAELDTIQFNDPVGITEDRRKAKDILQANKEFFVKEAVAFINTTFPLIGYDRATCERDIGLVLDAIGYDMMFGSNFRSITAGRSYYREGAAVVTESQKKATLAAFQFLKVIAADAVSAETLSASGIQQVDKEFTVTVEDDSYGLAKTGSFHIDGVERPVIELEPGAKYRFNQDDISNVYYGDLRHPLVFGQNENGTLQVGGQGYAQGVKFFLDGIEVTQEDYERDFATATTREVELDLTGNYTTEIWYGSPFFKGMGGQIYAKATGSEGDAGAKQAIEDRMNDIIQILDTGPDTTLTLNAPANVVEGEIITQLNSGASGEVKKENGTSITLITVSGTFTTNAADTLTGDESGSLSVYPTLVSSAPVPSLPTPTGGTGNASNADYAIAANAIVANRQFIVEEVVAYISENFPLLGYDRETCERDTGLVIDAVSYDMVFGSNFRSITAGRSYLRQSSGVLPAEQKAATTAAFTYLGTLLKALVIQTNADADTAKASIDSNIALINTIINDGISAVPSSFTIPSPNNYENTENAVDSYLPGYFNARENIAKNRAWIIAQVKQYIEDNHPGVAGDYDRDGKCTRDLGYILDAVNYDLTYGGNLETLVAGRAYYSDAGVQQLGTESDEITATLDAYNYLSGLLEQVALLNPDAEGDLNTVDGLTQDTTGNASNASGALRASSLIDDIITIIEDNSSAPTEEYPLITWVVGDNDNRTKQAIFNQFISERANLVKQVTTYIEENFAYLETKCRRDINYIVDAVRYDLTYGGNLETTVVGRSYFSDEGVNQLGSIREINATKAAYEYLEQIVQSVASNTSITAKNTVETQDTTGGSPSGDAASIKAGSLIEDIIKWIDNTQGDIGDSSNPEEQPDLSWVNSKLVTAHNTLQNEKALIKQSVTEFIEANYAYVQERCERDIRYIVDAVCYDIFYLGNSQAHLAAEQYFDGGFLQIPVPTKEATVRTFDYIRELCKDSVINIELSPLQTAVAQDLSLPAASSAQSDRIEDLFKVIVNLIQHGYSSTVTFDVNIATGGIPKIGERATFHQTSLITASGQTFEWVGSGTNINEAVPYKGGQPIQEQQVVESNEGKVYFTSTDQTGDFKIGNSLTIERATGTITGDTFDRSLFAVLTPYILSLQ